jgi:hypothetical protein
LTCIVDGVSGLVTCGPLSITAATAASHTSRSVDVGAKFVKVALELRSPVLKPSDYLRIGQSKLAGSCVAIGRK